MTREEAIKYADEITYRQAINNALSAKCVPYRKATKEKLHQLLQVIEDPETFVKQWAETNDYTLVANDVWRDAKRALEDRINNPNNELVKAYQQGYDKATDDCHLTMQEINRQFFKKLEIDDETYNACIKENKH